MIYPWQTEQWQHFLVAQQSKHLAHALLLSGMVDCGKKDFAKAVAHSILCENTDANGKACGQCKSCHVFMAGSHPDYKSLSLVEGKKDISIAQIRELSTFLELSCSYGQSKVAIIYDADRMNEKASNGLLKTLEEPPPNTVIILETSQPSALLATINSRCQQIVFPVPDKSAALAWLQSQQLEHGAEALLSMAGGRPLLAKKMDDKALLDRRKMLATDLLSLLNEQRDYVELAKHWEKEDFQTLLNWQLSWVQDLLLKSEKSQENHKSIDINKQLNQLSLLLDAARLWNLYDNLLSLMKLAKHPVNKILFAEKMLLIWLETKIN